MKSPEKPRGQVKVSHRGESAFSLLELLAGLALGSLVFIASFPALKTDLYGKKAVERALMAEIDLSFVEALISSSVRQSRRFCFFPGTFTSGGQLGVVLPGATLAFHAALENPLRPAAGSSNPVLCAHRAWSGTADLDPLAEIKAWLIVSADGSVLATGRAVKTRKTAACRGEEQYRGTFNTDSRLNEWLNPNQAPELNRLIARNGAAFFGVKDAFFFRLDKDGVLRRQSILGSENAPIASGVERFSPQLRQNGTLNILIKAAGGLERQINLPAPLQCSSFEVLG